MILGVVTLVHTMGLQSMFKSHEHRTALTDSGHRIDMLEKLQRKFERLHQVGALEDNEYETARKSNATALSIQF
jgi:nicotinic acid mononucleotide adenylyltransferase